MDKKFIFNLIALFVVIFAIIVYILFRFGSSSTPSVSTVPLKIINVNPPENISITYFPITQIEFTFDDKMDKNLFKYKIEPETETFTFLKQGTSNTIILSPKNLWKEGTNSITILKESKSLNNKTLEKDYVYKINISYPKGPPADAPGL